MAAIDEGNKARTIYNGNPPEHGRVFREEGCHPAGAQQNYFTSSDPHHDISII